MAVLRDLAGHELGLDGPPLGEWAEREREARQVDVPPARRLGRCGRRFGRRGRGRGRKGRCRARHRRRLRKRWRRERERRQADEQCKHQGAECLRDAAAWRLLRLTTEADSYRPIAVSCASGGRELQRLSFASGGRELQRPL
eukprot:6533020-Prymnesium_polylepis.1